MSAFAVRLACLPQLRTPARAFVDVLTGSPKTMPYLHNLDPQQRRAVEHGSRRRQEARDRQEISLSGGRDDRLTSASDSRGCGYSPQRSCQTKKSHHRETGRNKCAFGTGNPACAAFTAGAFSLSLVLTLGAARAENNTYVMKVTGPTIERCAALICQEFCRRGGTRFGGRIKSEVYPASQLG